MLSRFLLGTLLTIFGSLGAGLTGWSQTLILDEEFNQFAQRLTVPLRPTLVPQRQVHFVLVNDPDINAFVTPENLIYLHTGLIAQARSVAALQGVLAHELGHLAAGHLTTRDLMEKQALWPALTGAILGAGVAMAGAPQAAVAMALGGQALGLQNALSFSRTQENEADQQAVKALHHAGLSIAGMTELFNTLRTQTQLSFDSPPAWLVTHPLPQERLSRLQTLVQEEAPIKQQALARQEQAADWARIQAKVAALALSPAAVLRRYTGPTAVARYARALAMLRQGQVTPARALLTALHAEAPNDPYYLEALAQAAVMTNELPQATQYYRKALALVPQGLLLRFQLAELLRAQQQPAEAASHYRAITQAWPRWSEPWEGLGRTLGQLKRLGASHLAFTEAALAREDFAAAKQSLALARTYLKPADSKSDDLAWLDSLTLRLQTNNP